MGDAIAKVFPKSRRCLSLWHTAKEANQKLSSFYADSELTEEGHKVGHVLNFNSDGYCVGMP